MTTPDLMLNVADFKARSRIYGPGTRSVVWVQGCTIGCPGCWNKQMHPHEPRRLFDSEELGRLLAEIPEVDGLTFLGGEPFQQAKACARLLKSYRANGRSAVVYSGYPFSVLRRSQRPGAQHLLSQTDLLVAGPFVKRLSTRPLKWRGSSNQTIHYLTDRILPESDVSPTCAPLVEVSLKGSLATLTGFPEEHDLAWFQNIGGNVSSTTSPPKRRSNDESA